MHFNWFVVMQSWVSPQTRTHVHMDVLCVCMELLLSASNTFELLANLNALLLKHTQTQLRKLVHTYMFTCINGCKACVRSAIVAADDADLGHPACHSVCLALWWVKFYDKSVLRRLRFSSAIIPPACICVCIFRYYYYDFLFCGNCGWVMNNRCEPTKLEQRRWHTR